MQQPSDSYGAFWEYLSQPQRDLILEGNYLMKDIIGHSSYHFKDYSFLVFPIAKAYEGYLKTLFKDVKFISHLDYISDHLRLGKLLSPFLVGRLGERSLYKKIKDAASKELADQIWTAWKIGRNEIFHYFPHNLKGISFEEAQNIVDQIFDAMEAAYGQLYPLKENMALEDTKNKLQSLMQT